MNKLCKDCRYYSKMDDKYGRCRRFPPVFRHGRDYVYPLIPVGMKTCGEVKPIEKEA